VKNCGWITYWHISKERSNTSRVTWGEAAKEQRLPNFARDLEIGNTESALVSIARHKYTPTTAMSQSICSRCISRSYLSIETSSPSINAVQRAAFSTSPSLAANPPKKKGAVAKSTSRQGTTLRLNKNKRDTTGRPPAPGERKALRKKVVLSNTNAIEVKGLQELNRENGTAARLAELEGQVLTLTDANVEALRSLEAFKHTQAWNLFRKPATVIRKDTVEIAKALEAAEGGEDGKAKEAVKKVLFGEKGSGKSVLQLQAMALALNKGWVVIHIPNGMLATRSATWIAY
jgi:small subunit ribosomal protein S29